MAWVRKLTSRTSGDMVDIKIKLYEKDYLVKDLKEIQKNSIDYANDKLYDFLRIIDNDNNVKKKDYHNFFYEEDVRNSQDLYSLKDTIERNTSFIIEEIYLALDTMIKYFIINEIYPNGSDIELIDFLILNRYLFDNDDKIKTFIKKTPPTDTEFNIKIKQLKQELIIKNYKKIQRLVLLGE
jgi:hypothetical protein